MAAINTYVSRWKPNTPFDFEVVRRVAKVSSPMRSYYFSSVVKPYGEHLGYDADEVLLLHKQLKIVYFQIRLNRGVATRKTAHGTFAISVNFSLTSGVIRTRLNAYLTQFETVFQQLPFDLSIQ